MQVSYDPTNVPSKARKYAAPPDHMRNEISFSRTCSIPNLEAKNH